MEKACLGKSCFEGLPQPLIALVFGIIVLNVASSMAQSTYEDYTPVSATDIMDKINKCQPIDYDHVIINGDLNWRLLKNLPKNEKGMRIVNVSISINDSIINGCIDLFRVNFRQNVYFNSNKFKKPVSFDMSHFDSRSWFTESEFNDTASFVYTYFNDDAFFLSSKFNKSAHFWETHFFEDVDFGSVIFYNIVQFNFAAFKGDGYFNHITINDTINLDRAKFTKLEVRWDSLKDHLIFNQNVYLLLIENYKKLGWFSDADSCYYQYRSINRDKFDSGWSKLLSFIAYFSCGYGVKPSYTLFWSLVVVFLFGLLFWLGNDIHRSSEWDHGEVQVCKWSVSIFLDALRNKVHQTKISLENIIFNFERALPVLKRQITQLTMGKIMNRSFETKIQFSDALYFSLIVFVSQPSPHWRVRGRWRYAVMIEDVLGWLLLALFIITLSNVMIR